MPNPNSPVLVALSGGVDSAVAAACLVDQGFRVSAAYMKNWTNEPNILGDCPWQQDIEDARAVAQHLDIPFQVLNFIDAYHDRVVQYMVDGYRKGLTPNPDVLCNREMKFGILLDWALANGFASVATGHYCQTVQTPDGPALLEGRDANKDQSYFLSLISRRQLQCALFPIGNLRKPEVRQRARQIGLPNAEKKDSQGICFIGRVRINDFLKAYIPDQPGPILDTDGRTRGQHRGLHRYTLGQRRGIGVPSNADNRFFVVVAKDFAQNALIIGFEDERPAPLWQSRVQIHNASWLLPTPPTTPTEIEVKVRYRDPRIPAIWHPDPNAPTQRGSLEFQSPQRALASGQIAALYQGPRLIGGAIYL